MIDASEGHPALEGKIDRVSRALLRFPGGEDKAAKACCWAGCVPFHVSSHLSSHFSPDVNAQFLCLQHSTEHLDEVRELVVSDLSGEGIALEPIVWARLLHKLLPSGPDDHDTAQYFSEIVPSNFWKADFIPPPVYEWEDIKIIENANNQRADLKSTFCQYLYPWVGGSIIQGQLNVTDSIFNPKNPDDYPSLQDPRLRFLLTMAGLGWAPMDTFALKPSDVVCELTDRLAVHFPLIVNVVFEYATAQRLFDCLVERLHYSLKSYYFIPKVLKIFITGLSSPKLEEQISRNLLRYLREPDVLFAVCAFLVGGSFRQPLHDLAHLCRNVPCLAYLLTEGPRIRISCQYIGAS
ncbi:hypothetical protein IW261DRAFT_1557426 [Armillaria novae-zelandiae]|uniref:Uncharacterized protein n=1 Tax=Armillaria novae-zelandiae TaxID=153914 RepID=A0AA39PRZ1_9AGAR|nr:hypothetical protein IW261DRAFT_1557426 [Armillaria novae-zelandiae]